LVSSVDISELRYLLVTKMYKNYQKITAWDNITKSF